MGGAWPRRKLVQQEEQLRRQNTIQQWWKFDLIRSGKPCGLRKARAGLLLTSTQPLFVGCVWESQIIRIDGCLKRKTLVKYSPRNRETTWQNFSVYRLRGSRTSRQPRQLEYCNQCLLNNKSARTYSLSPWQRLTWNQRASGGGDPNSTLRSLESSARDVVHVKKLCILQIPDSNNSQLNPSSVHIINIEQTFFGGTDLLWRKSWTRIILRRDI